MTERNVPMHDRNLINLIADLTPSEAHALQTHLRYAGDESYAAYGHSDTVRELDAVTGYVAGIRRNTLGTARHATPPAPRTDSAVTAHEAVFASLTRTEREAFAVHMDSAQGAYRDAGGTGPMLAELVTMAHDAGYAAVTSDPAYASRAVKLRAATPVRTVG